MTAKPCHICGGTRRVTREAKFYLGGKYQKTTTYQAECPRCLGAELWAATGRLITTGAQP